LITSGIAGRPTGTVRVNPRAPYAYKLVGAFLFSNQGYALDLAGRNSTPLGTAVQVPAPFGLGAQTLTGQGFVTPSPPPFVASFAVGGHIPTANQTGLVIGAGDDVWNMASFNWGCFTSSGTWRFGVGLRGSVGASTPAPVGRFAVGMSRDPTAIVPTATCYVSGVPVLSDTYNGGTDASKQLRSTVSVQAPSQVILDYLLMFSATLPDWVHAEISRNPYQYFQTAGRSLWYVPAAAGGLSISASSALSLGASAAVSTGTSMSIATSIAFGASATVVQGMSLAATSALSLGASTGVSIVGPPASISASSALSLGAASTVTLTSPALSVSASSALSLGASAGVSIVGPPTTVSASSSLSLGAASTVMLTSPNVGIAAASSLSLGASTGVSIVGPPTTISTSSALSIGAAAGVALTSQAIGVSASSAVSFGASAGLSIVGPPTTVSASSTLSLGASASVTLAGSTALAFASSSALSLGSSAVVAAAGPPAGPQRAVYADIVARLVALGCFAEGGVGRGAPSEVLMRSGRQYPCAAVQPLAWVDGDRYDAGDFIRTCTFTITLIVRMEEPDARQDWLDYLSDRACNALDGVSLAGIAFGPLTIVQRGQYGPTPQHPEQRATLTGQFVYEVVGYGARDETEPT